MATAYAAVMIKLSAYALVLVTPRIFLHNADTLWIEGRQWQSEKRVPLESTWIVAFNMRLRRYDCVTQC
eukprot:5201410-Ditylum_brightwellii.AAC.1